MAVGFFTHGVQFTLPHPPIQERTLLLLRNVIQRAWRLLKENEPVNFLLASEKEDTITQMLVEIIENRLRTNEEVAGFDRRSFGYVAREPKISNYNKQHPDKMPDIFFPLNRKELVLSDQDGLFVECKPVDSKHPVLSCYCQTGLIRFVNGDYAWAMQNALMVGYVAEGYTFQKLAAALDDKDNATFGTNSHSELAEQGTYHSIHQREFQWLEGHGKACSISVAHLWLQI